MFIHIRGLPGLHVPSKIIQPNGMLYAPLPPPPMTELACAIHSSPLKQYWLLGYTT